jgi:ArsR family transcriptional regulator
METTDAVAALGALAQDSRLDVFRLLVRTGREGLPAGEIGERLKIPPATLSFHLAQLRQAGLVTMKREGRSLIYSADYDGMNDLMSFLTENCCAGADCRVPVCDPASASVLRRKPRKRLRQ